MKKILNFINDLTLDDQSEQIIRGEIEPGLILGQTSKFNRLGLEEQNNYLVKLNDRIKQITKPYKLLNVLLLVDTILKTNTEIDLPKITYPNLRLDNSKEHTILINIVNYYHRYIHWSNLNRYNKYTLNAEEDLYEAQNFCEISIKKILEFIKIDFVFVQAWTKVKEHRMLLRQIVGSILERFKEDLSILNTFVKNNIELVLQKTIRHPLVFQINDAYEKLIHINKQMKKIQKISKLYNFDIEFPRYQIDVELNRQIELEMLERKEQKKQFFDNRNKVQAEARVNKAKKYDCYVEEDLEEVNIDVKSSHSFLLLREEEQE